MRALGCVRRSTRAPSHRHIQALVRSNDTISRECLDVPMASGLGEDRQRLSHVCATVGKSKQPAEALRRCRPSLIFHECSFLQPHNQAQLMYYIQPRAIVAACRVWSAPVVRRRRKRPRISLHRMIGFRRISSSTHRAARSAISRPAAVPLISAALIAAHLSLCQGHPSDHCGSAALHRTAAVRGVPVHPPSRVVVCLRSPACCESRERVHRAWSRGPAAAQGAHLTRRSANRSALLCASADTSAALRHSGNFKHQRQSTTQGTQTQQQHKGHTTTTSDTPIPFPAPPPSPPSAPAPSRVISAA